MKIILVTLLSILLVGCTNQDNLDSETTIIERRYPQWIIGKWIISSTELEPFRFISCESLTKNYIIEFTENQVKTYQAGDSINLCNQYNYYYNLENSKLTLLESDMVQEVVIEKSNAKEFSIKLGKSNVPPDLINDLTIDSMGRFLTKGFKINLKKIE